MNAPLKTPAPRNRTLVCTEADIAEHTPAVAALSGSATADSLVDRVINQDFATARSLLPLAFVDLLILDPLQPHQELQRARLPLAGFW